MYEAACAGARAGTSVGATAAAIAASSPIEKEGAGRGGEKDGAVAPVGGPLRLPNVMQGPSREFRPVFWQAAPKVWLRERLGFYYLAPHGSRRPALSS